MSYPDPTIDPDNINPDLDENDREDEETEESNG